MDGRMVVGSAGCFISWWRGVCGGSLLHAPLAGAGPFCRRAHWCRSSSRWSGAAAPLGCDRPHAPPCVITTARRYTRLLTRRESLSSVLVPAAAARAHVVPGALVLLDVSLESGWDESARDDVFELRASARCLLDSKESVIAGLSQDDSHHAHCSFGDPWLYTGGTTPCVELLFESALV
eukprot:1844359-Pleurochrysis_carterae.AAC.1